MRSDTGRANRTTRWPSAPATSSNERTNFAYTKSSLPQSDQYVELDDFYTPSSPAQNPRYRSSPAKRQRVYIPNTLWTRAFAGTVILETILTVGIESWIFISVSYDLAQHGEEAGTLRLRSFLGLYIFALLYELVLSYDALRRKNTFQLVGLCICNAGLLTYGIIQISEVKDTITNLVDGNLDNNHLWEMYRIGLILVPVVLGVGTNVMMLVTWKLRAEFLWSIYKNISADLKMNRRYTTYQVYIALLKFDFFFIFGTQLQILLALGEIDDDFVINAAMVPIAIIALILAARFCRREKMKSMAIPLICICGIAGSMVKALERTDSSSNSDGLGSYRVSLTLFAAIAILLLVCTLVNSLLCMLNFRKGLKDHIDQLRGGKPDSVQVGLTGHGNKSRFVLN